MNRDLRSGTLSRQVPTWAKFDNYLGSGHGKQAYNDIFIDSVLLMLVGHEAYEAPRTLTAAGQYYCLCFQCWRCSHNMRPTRHLVIRQLLDNIIALFFNVGVACITWGLQGTRYSNGCWIDLLPCNARIWKNLLPCNARVWKKIWQTTVCVSDESMLCQTSKQG